MGLEETVYGVVLDGRNWAFLRLEQTGKGLQVGRPYLILAKGEGGKCKYLDTDFEKPY